MECIKHLQVSKWIGQLIQTYQRSKLRDGNAKCALKSNILYTKCNVTARLLEIMLKNTTAPNLKTNPPNAIGNITCFEYVRNEGIWRPKDVLLWNCAENHQFYVGRCFVKHSVFWQTVILRSKVSWKVDLSKLSRNWSLLTSAIGIFLFMLSKSVFYLVLNVNTVCSILFFVAPW